jgi:hypothetical protein
MRKYGLAARGGPCIGEPREPVHKVDAHFLRSPCSLRYGYLLLRFFQPMVYIFAVGVLGDGAEEHSDQFDQEQSSDG